MAVYLGSKRMPFAVKAPFPPQNQEYAKSKDLTPSYIRKKKGTDLFSLAAEFILERSKKLRTAGQSTVPVGATYGSINKSVPFMPK
ncbi:MAG: hypothetical protein WCP58_12380, partial [bacterium]